MTDRAVRQKTPAVVKDAVSEVGFRVRRPKVDSGVFFDCSAGKGQNTGHMYVDLNTYTNNPTTPFPIAYMDGWYAGPDGENVAQAANDWSGANSQRYNNPEYDALFEQARTETDLDAAAELLVRMNDVLIEDVVLVPLVNRAADEYAMATSLIHGEDAAGLPLDNVANSPYEYNYRNIANRSRAPE